MNNQRPTTNKTGFTLIEMLVVIAILGILMAMMVPAAGLILKRAAKARAQADAGIVTTVMLKYRAEYNRWPEFYKTEERHLTDGGWVAVMSPSPGSGKPNVDNLKRIIFFEPGGGALDALTGSFVDPWGQPYEYMLDLDGDGSIPHPSGEGTIKAQAIAWSAGTDKRYETWDDNATSWE